MNAAYNITIIICLLVSLIIYLIGKAKPIIKAFALLMLVTAIIEIGNLYNIFPYYNNDNNHWTYNILTVFEFYFFSYFFYRILAGSFSRKLIRVFVFVYPLVLIISFLTIQKWYNFHSYTYILGELYLVILCLLYFKELYMAREFKKLSTLPEFWIVTGLLIFTSGQLPYMILINYLNTHFLKASAYFNYYILTSMNILMYTMFSIGLLWSIKTQK
jgi:hypothetical protein